MNIPNHSLLKLYDGKKDIFGEKAKLIVNEAFTFTSSSDFKSLYTAPDNSLTDVLGIVSLLSSDYNEGLRGKSEISNSQLLGRGVATLGEGMSGKYKEFGFQVYKSTEPLKLNLQADIYATFNAKIQVYDVVNYLLKLPLPTTRQELNKYPAGDLLGFDSSFNVKSSSFTEDNDSQSSGSLFNPLIIPGPSFKMLNPLQKEEDKKKFSQGRTFTISIGDIFFDDMFITSVAPTFSAEKMKVGNLFYPMSCKLNIEISSVWLMTKGMMHDMIRGGV